MNVHALPTLVERPGLGGRLVRRAVVITSLALILLAGGSLSVLVWVQVEITIAASGRLEPLEVWRVHSFATGVVKEVPAQPGQRVEIGDVLARLDPFALESELASRRLEARHRRHGRMAARSELDRLEMEIADLESRLLRLTIVSPERGVMLSEELDRLLGQRVGDGQLLFEIGSPGSWKAVLEVPEREIDTIRIGDPVRLSIPAVSAVGALTPERLPATVSFVGSAPTETSTPRSSRYRIHAALESAAIDAQQRSRLRRGMSVEARVVTRSARAIDLVVDHLKRQAGLDD